MKYFMYSTFSEILSLLRNIFPKVFFKSRNWMILVGLVKSVHRQINANKLYNSGDLWV